MQLRYAFRLHPTRGQRAALGRAFGSARVVCNDAVRARREAYAQDLPYPRQGLLSRVLITEAKRRPDGRRTGGVGLRSAGKTGSDPGTARRNRKPRTPDRKLCRVAAQQPVEKARIPGLRPGEQVKA
ncbi:helix-turn-helix domain-containing protein [Streptomyces sp. NPDC049541]|uniref:helix-turn-helix domain-containing protein n=1 Tax=Streptomyces sp. NPDC049541 TaxID=3365594 RepID=UPI00378CD077